MCSLSGSDMHTACSQRVLERAWHPQNSSGVMSESVGWVTVVDKDSWLQSSLLPGLSLCWAQVGSRQFLTKITGDVEHAQEHISWWRNRISNPPHPPQGPTCDLMQVEALTSLCLPSLDPPTETQYDWCFCSCHQNLPVSSAWTWSPWACPRDPLQRM